MGEGTIFPLHQQQADAVDPAEHVWLSASAGTGKTQVLSARVFRLLLQPGVDPANILCLTFTKAGAAEMANRVNATLARWVRLPQAQLRQELHAIGADNGPEGQERARKLFARVLDAPGGGLRIMTIHSFCQTLLAAFPEEAGATPFFRPLEDAERKLLANEALNQMLAEAEREGRHAIIEAVSALSLRMGEEEAKSFLLRCASATEAMEAMPSGVQPFVRSLVDLPLEGDGESWMIAQCEDSVCPLSDLRSLADGLATLGTAKEKERAALVHDWLASDPATRATSLDTARAGWRTKSGGTVPKANKQVAANFADYEEIAERLILWSDELLGKAALFAYADLLAGGLAAGREFYVHYARAKAVQGLVDFDDLIRLAARLLKRSDMAAWIRYKMDQRTDHILVDEAQDTNLSQWDIVEALTEEFFAGKGTEPERSRTVFTVGDFKQAIFGFQGTSPEFYQKARTKFFENARNGGSEFKGLSLDLSFRSSQPVLQCADAVIDHLGHEALGLDDGVPLHHSFFDERYGRVQLWDPVDAADAEAKAVEEDWLGDEKLLFADRLAQQVKQWLNPATALPVTSGDKARPLRPGDIMILVSKRDELASLIIARLHAAAVPVAGIDRLKLQQPLVVQDMLAAIRFVLQPGDDLNLAGLLVSPLLGWSQDDLLKFGYRGPDRKVTLWQHIRDLKLDDHRIEPLRAMLRMADYTTPYQFLETILSGPIAGRKAMARRFGSAALDPLEELLAQALAFEKEHPPSLQGFVDWFDRGEVEVKREQAEAADEVRLLTVHGSKGLQAPLVIMANATFDPGRKTQRQISLPDMTRPELSLKYPAIAPRKAERVGVLSALETVREVAEMQEHWRLLYVAMTRAEQHLVVAGALGPGARGEVPADSWYAAVDNALQKLGAEKQDHALWGQVRQFDGAMTLPKVMMAEAPQKPETGQDIPLPEWALAPAPPESRPPRPLAPSRAAEDDAVYPPSGKAGMQAAERGRILHRLLQLLPGQDDAAWEQLAQSWLARQAQEFNESERSSIAEDVLATLREPDWADLFSGDALAEAPITAVVGDQVVSGVVDRMLVGDHEILLVDFKSGAFVPKDSDEVPIAYLRQMAAYVAATKTLFPERKIRAALLYTSGPYWIELSEKLLETHKPGFSRA